MSHQDTSGSNASRIGTRLASTASLLALTLAAGCSGGTSPGESIGTATQAVTATSKVVVNQFGYVVNLTKIAAVVDPTCAAGMAFSVKNSGGTAVCNGTLLAPIADQGSGETVCKADFSACATGTGTGFTVDVPGIGTSDPFSIADKGKNLYPTTMFEDAIYYFTFHRVGTQRVTISLTGSAPSSTVTRDWTMRGNDGALGAYGGWTAGTFNVDGGTADAGDFGIYPDNAVQAMWVLGNLQELKQPSTCSGGTCNPVSLSKLPDTTKDLLSEYIYGTKFLKGALPADTTKLAGHKFHDAEWYPEQPWNTSDGGTATYTAGGSYDGSGSHGSRAASGPSSTATYAVARGLAQMVRVAGGRLNSVTMGGQAQSEAGFWAAAQDAWNRVQGRDSEVWNPYSVAENGPAPAGNPYSMGFATGGGPYNDGFAGDDKFAAAVEMFLTAKARGESYTTYLSVVNSTALNCKANGQASGTSVRCLASISRRYFDWESDYVAGNLSLLAYHLSRGGSCTVVAGNPETFSSCTGGISADVPDLKLVANAVVAEGKNVADTIDANGYPVPLAGNDYPWGSNKVVMHSAMIAAYAHILTSNARYQKAVYQSMDYMLGQNTLRLSQITGYGTRFDVATHDRQADGNSPVGWLAGGPINGAEVNDYWPGHPGFNGNPPQWGWDGVSCDKRFTRAFCLHSNAAYPAPNASQHCPSPVPALADYPELPTCPAGTPVTAADGSPYRVDCCPYPETPRRVALGTPTTYPLTSLAPNYSAKNFAINELPGTIWDCYTNPNGAGCMGGACTTDANCSGGMTCQALTCKWPSSAWSGAKPPRQPHRWSWCSEENTIDWNAPFVWDTWYIRGGCESNADCNDNNGCTTDTCNTGTGFCTHAAANEGTACDDSNACTSTDVCTNGACRGTANSIACADDGSACTNDVCSSGACSHPILSSCQGGTGLKGDYYSGTTLSGSPVVTHAAEAVNFDWAAGRPAGMPADDSYSVRWTGSIKALYSQTYTFTETSDDGGRLKIWTGTEPGTWNVIDAWADGAAAPVTGTFAMTAGTSYNIKYEFYEGMGDASAKLEWASASQPQQVIPVSQLFPAGGTCTAETDTAFCSRLGKNCGQVTAADNCGTSRTVSSCGTCTSPATCAGGGTANVCGTACTPETDSAFCSRLGKNCGTVSANDNCGTARSANCGSCTSPVTCGGGGTANVCGGTCTCADDGNPCTVDACDGGGVCQHTAGNAGAVCRASAGACDPQETCTGASTTCPTNLLTASGTVCRTSAGACDVAETCTGSSAACPSDVFAASSVVCRSAVAGGCDNAENCTGTSSACPTDSVKASGTVCRASAGTCDTQETCNGTANTCPTDAFAPSSTVCRAAAGSCDNAENCSGTAAACPADALKASGTVCRSATGSCDIAETCSGSVASCPTDAFAANGTACTGGTCNGSGTCNASCTPETDAAFCTRLAKNCGSVTANDNCGASRTVASCGTCTSPATCGGAGTANVCGTASSDPCSTPTILTGSGTFTVNQTGTCFQVDVAANVNGIMGTVINNGTANTTVVWYGGTSQTVTACTQVSQDLTGNGAQINNFAVGKDTVKASAGKARFTVKSQNTTSYSVNVSFQSWSNGTGCTSPAPSGSCTCADDGNPCTVDACDANSVCQHTAGNAGTVCRASTGTCDAAETCSGSSTTCPTDGFAPSSTVCRASAGACDAAENCTGTSAACPTDGFAPSSTVCRAAAGTCDNAENCTGTSAACPTDAVKASGTSCRASAGVCDVAETCNGSTAACPTDAFAASTVVCRTAAGECDIADNCSGSAAACPTDAFKASGTACTGGSCNGTGTCSACTLPAAPTGLTAGGGSGSATLSWSAVSGATSYTVRRGTVSGGPYSDIATGVASTTYVNTVAAGTYFYVIAAVSSCGTGSNSSQASATVTASCTPETDAAFCTRLAKNCGSVTANDNCGAVRSNVACGTCTSPATCGGGGTANVCGGGGGATLFSDDFQDNNANGWTPSGGTWSVLTDGTLAYGNNGGSYLSTAGSTAWTDQFVQSKVKVVQFGGTSNSYRAGLIARYTTSSNYYALALDGAGNLGIRKSSSTISGCADVASGVAVNTWATLRLEATGSTTTTLKSYVNGTLKQTCTITSGALTAGSIGVHTYGSNTSARFDDVLVTSP